MFSLRCWSRQLARILHKCNNSSFLSSYGRRCLSTEDGKCLGKKSAVLWGNGDFGRLGLGSLDSRLTPTFISSTAVKDLNLKSIACGGAHTLLLSESGRVFACGLNSSGQLGVSTDISYSMEPIEVNGFDKEIVHISAGYCHSCAITVDGELYAWGKNSSGQLGLGKKAKGIIADPSRIPGLDEVKIKVAALGSEHSIAVTDKGEALSWGGGDSGQLGHGHKSGFTKFLQSPCEYTPRLIKALEGMKVTSVGAGLLHSACVDDKGSAFVFGGANMLGFKLTRNDQIPSEIISIPSSDLVSCGGYHSCVITHGGELYTFGSNENGCLGIGYTSAAHLPERVRGAFVALSVDKVSCGWKHTAAISGGKIYTWGWGGSNGTFSVDGLSSAGQLGHGDDVDYFYPMMIELHEGFKALEVSCGFNHTGAILQLQESS